MERAHPQQFLRYGPVAPQFPVILSVPHAGRTYPPTFHMLARQPFQRLIALEDRFADLLVERAVSRGFTALIAQVPRVWIDLNRAEDDVDPQMFEPVMQNGQPLSTKARSGLGLIPARTPGVGDIWKSRLPLPVVEERLRTHYRPYHAALSEEIKQAKTKFGGALLLDMHSMPPLKAVRGEAADIVVGDRFGRSCSGRIATLAVDIAASHGFTVAMNAPYAGGHILERHGNPQSGVHALQIEIGRHLYLDRQMKEIGAGLGLVQSLIEDLALGLASEIDVRPTALAAE